MNLHNAFIGGSNMEFLEGFVVYGLKYIVLVIVAVAGIYAGKAIRFKKDAKKIEE